MFRTLDGFPVKLRTTLPYADFYNLTSTSGIPAVQQWRLNSLFDPDLTLTGHQPMFRDTYAGVYATYLVLNTRVTFKFTLNSSTSNAVMVSIRPVFNSTATPASLNLEAERPGGHELAVTADNITTFTHTYSMSQVAGLAFSQYYNDSFYTASQGANPTNPIVLNVLTQPLDITATVTANIWAKFEFDVLFTDLIQNQSQN